MPGTGTDLAAVLGIAALVGYLLVFVALRLAPVRRETR